MRCEMYYVLTVFIHAEWNGITCQPSARREIYDIITGKIQVTARRLVNHINFRTADETTYDLRAERRILNSQNKKKYNKYKTYLQPASREFVRLRPATIVVDSHVFSWDIRSIAKNRQHFGTVLEFV